MMFQIDWLILMACQAIQGYFMSRGRRITFILHYYLHFCCSFSYVFFFFFNSVSLNANNFFDRSSWYKDRRLTSTTKIYQIEPEMTMKGYSILPRFQCSFVWNPEHPIFREAVSVLPLKRHTVYYILNPADSLKTFDYLELLIPNGKFLIFIFTDCQLLIVIIFNSFLFKLLKELF